MMNQGDIGGECGMEEFPLSGLVISSRCSMVGRESDMKQGDVKGDVRMNENMIVKVAALGQVVEFVKGGRYEGGLGTYDVLCLKPDGMMTVQYVQAKSSVSVGQVCEYKMQVQAEVIVRMRLEAKKAAEEKKVIKKVMELEGEGYEIMAMWLAEKGTFRVQLPEKAVDAFVDQYQELTGETPDMSDKKTVRIRDSYRWVGLRVDFPMPKDDEKSFLDIPKGVHMSTDGYNCSISDNAFVGGFLRMGLKLGKNKGWAKKAA